MDDEIISTGIAFDTSGIEKGNAALDALAKTGDKASKSLDEVGASAGKAGKNLGNLGGAAAAPITQVGDAAGKASQEIKGLADATEDAAKSLSSGGGLAQGLNVAKAAALGFVGAFSVATLVQAAKAYLNIADAVTNLTTQLRLAEGSTIGAAQAYEQLFVVAQRSRVSFVELGNTYAQIKRATDGLGLSSRDTLRITESLAKAITISGASAGAASAALTQLSQGLASGTLRGDELNSILEQTPRIARALADGLGVSVGQLRELGAAGQLTGERVAEALLKASAAIDREFGQSVATVGQATTVLGNSITALVGELDRASGTSATVARSLVSIADAVDKINVALRKLESNPLKSLVLPQAGTLATAIPLPLRALDTLADRLVNGRRAESIDTSGNDAITERMARESVAALNAANKMDEAVNKFANASGNLSRQQVKLSEQRDLLTQFAASVKGFAQDSSQYLRAYGALQQGLANIDNKFKDKGAGGSRSALADDFSSARQQGQAYAAIIGQLVGVQAKYTDQIDRSSAAQQVLNKAIASGAFASLPANLQEAIKAFVAETEAVQENAEAKLLLAKIQRDVEVSNAKAADDRAKYVETLQAEIARERERVEQIGLTREAIDARTMAQMDATIAAKEATLADLQLVEAQSPLIAAYEEEIRLLRERRGLFVLGADRQAEVARREEIVRSAKDAEAAWQKTSDEINRGLTDSLFRAAEAGKGFFETLRDSIVGMFNNLVLRPIISATVGAVTSGLGLTGTANATTGLGSIGTLAGLGGSIGAFGSGFGSGLSAWGAGGSVTGLLSSGSALFAGGMANGLGVIAGALGPIALGVAAIAAIVSALDDGGGPKSGGSFSTTGERLFTPADSDAIARGIGETIVAQTNSLISRYGGALGASTVSIGFDRDPQGDAGSRIASRVIDALGRTTLDNSAGRQVNEAEFESEMQIEAQRVLLAALQASNLEDGFADVFARLNPATAAPEAIANLLTLADTLYQLGEASKLLPGVMGDVADLSATAREQLIGFAGGLDAMVSAQAAYYSEFYSEAERYAQAQTNLTSAFADLGLAFTQVDTREEFRAIVEGIDLTTESGRGLYASLLTLAGPLAQWIDAADALAKASATAATAIAPPSDSATEAWFATILTPLQNAERQFGGVVEQLAAHLGITADAARELTTSDLATWAYSQQQSWDTLTEAQRASLVAVIEITPAFDDLSETISDITTSGEIDTLNTQMQSMIDTFGDIEGAMRELNPPALNLVDTWRETRGAIEQIQQALGTFVDMSTSGQIAAVVDARAANLAQRDSIVAFRDSLTDSIFEAMLSGLSPSDQAAQLRAAEREAFTSIGTASDPVAAAQRAMDLSLRRIALEAQIEEEGRRGNLDLAEDARQLQEDTLRDQIDGLRTLADYADRLLETSFELKTGGLSALNPETQLSLAKNEFERLAVQARGGDRDALASIGGVAQTLLEEARGVYGSGRPYASIFSGVTGTLDELGASASTAAQQAEMLSQQLAALEATQLAAEFTADTSAETVAILTAIDAALAAREDALDTSIAAQTAALTGLLTTLTTVETNQRAQITQSAAIWTQIQTRLDGLIEQQGAQARSTQAQEAIV